MGLTTFQIALAVGMLITGSINTLSTKAADLQTATNRYGNNAYFSHPFVQAVGMFVGELSCLFVYTVLSYRAHSSNDATFKRAKPHSKFIFLIPALCDMTAVRRGGCGPPPPLPLRALTPPLQHFRRPQTSVMYVGLSLTSSSMFQMLRGSVVIFTATFSRIFLNKTIHNFQWLGVLLVLLGTLAVGLSSVACKDACDSSSSSAQDSKAMVGNVLIIVAQVIVAVQMVVEEKLIGGYDIPPLQVVGWEGLWGFSILSVVLWVMYYIPTTGTPMCALNTGPNTTSTDACSATVTYAGEAVCSHVEDAYDAFLQLGRNPLIAVFTVLNICSIAFFNFFGVSVTKYGSAAMRMVLDSLRTMVIWGFSLGLKWEKFCYMQIIGFVVLLAGTMVYNSVVRVPGFEYPAEAAGGAEGEDSEAGLLEGGGDDYAELETSSLNTAAPATPGDMFRVRGMRK